MNTIFPGPLGVALCGHSAAVPAQGQVQLWSVSVSDFSVTVRPTVRLLYLACDTSGALEGCFFKH